MEMACFHGPPMKSVKMCIEAERRPHDDLQLADCLGRMLAVED